MERARLIQGVGINDADYAVIETDTSTGKHVISWRCPIYAIWAAMIMRCYSTTWQKHRPNYADCVVCNDWLRFSVFRKWVLTQDWQGKSLDKDILLQGNKIYSPETCVFVDQLTNSFVAHNTYPDPTRGTFWREDYGKYKSYCGNPFTKKHDNLGSFVRQEDAHAAWCVRKTELAELVAQKQTDKRVAKALRTRYW